MYRTVYAALCLAVVLSASRASAAKASAREAQPRVKTVTHKVTGLPMQELVIDRKARIVRALKGFGVHGRSRLAFDHVELRGSYAVGTYGEQKYLLGENGKHLDKGADAYHDLPDGGLVYASGKRLAIDPKTSDSYSTRLLQLTNERGTSAVVLVARGSGEAYELATGRKLTDPVQDILAASGEARNAWKPARRVPEGGESRYALERVYPGAQVGTAYAVVDRQTSRELKVRFTEEPKILAGRYVLGQARSKTAFRGGVSYDLATGLGILIVEHPFEGKPYYSVHAPGSQRAIWYDGLGTKLADANARMIEKRSRTGLRLYDGR